MGWNAKCVFIRKDRQSLFAGGAIQNSVEARNILRRLNYNPTSSVLSNLEVGIRPPHGWLCVGANQTGCILSNFPEIEKIAQQSNNTLVDQCLLAFPRAEILAFELASSTNYFAYELYQENSLIRRMAGSAERGLLVDEGDLQPEELNIVQEQSQYTDVYGIKLNRSRWQHNFDANQNGELLVFALAGRFLGSPLDICALEDFQVELFEKHKLFWPFNRKNKLLQVPML